jgi:hypothetical protein
VTTEWRAIPGYEDCYEVSDDGQVRGIDRWADNGRVVRFIPGVLKTPRVPATGSHKGYREVTLHREGKRIPYPVHSLVAAAFIGERPRGYCVEHYEDKLDDSVGNLHYVRIERNIEWMNDRPADFKAEAQQWVVTELP